MVDEQEKKEEAPYVRAGHTRILIKNNSHASGTLPETHPPHPRSILRQLRGPRFASPWIGNEDHPGAFRRFRELS